MMVKRIKRAISKLFFCLKISGNARCFFYLMWNTKKFRWKKEFPKLERNMSRPVPYFCKIENQLRYIFLRTSDGDLDIFYEIFWDRIYNLPESYFDQFNLIVDLGSHTGLSAIFFLSKSKSAKVICVEPETRNYELLLVNLEREILEGRIIPVQAAVSDSEGHVSINLAPLKYNNSIYKAARDGDSVDSVSLNGLLSKLRIDHIDLLKIDIEGSEKLLFAAETQWLAKVDHVIIEIHSETDKKMCFEALVSRGFEIRPLGMFIEQSIYWAQNKKSINTDIEAKLTLKPF
jgi:FkbM family methyltransferase